jgi:tetratricopeptide (TPR) repeat protein
VKTQIESFRRELKGDKGFDKDSWAQAAEFAVAHNTNLDDALVWSDYSINGPFIGQKTFKTLGTRATVLEKMGRNAEADSLRKEAMPLASMNELHGYGRQLLAQKKPVEALAAFKLNAQKNPNVYTTNMGLARGYSANGDFKNALKYIKLAQPQSPNKQNADAIEKYIKMLEEKKDINQ